jgi:hypothetical protein
MWSRCLATITRCRPFPAGAGGDRAARGERSKHFDMNSDDFPVDKINVLPVSFQRNRGNRIPGYIINDKGKVYFTFHQIKKQINSLIPDDEVINDLVSKRGFIHIWPIGQSIYVSLRPELVNFTSMTAAFYVIASCRPARVFLSTEAENTGWELFSTSQRAMTRIENLVTTSRKGGQLHFRFER